MLRQMLALFLLLALAGCSQQDSTFFPVTHDRIEYLGVSLLPPPGDNWFVAEQRDINEWRLVFKHKQPDGTDTGLYIMLVVDALPAQFHPQFATHDTVLQEFQKRLDVPDPEHVKTLSNANTRIVVDGTDAVSHTRSSEDTANAVLIDIQSIALPHPKDPTLGVMITLTCRHHPDAPPISLSQLTATLLHDLHFTPPVRNALQ